MESAASLTFNESAAVTIPLEVPAAPACTIAVCPSREIDTPGAGGMTLRTAGLLRSVASTLATALLKSGAAIVSPWFLLLTAFVGVNQWLYVIVGACPASLALRRACGLRSAVYASREPAGARRSGVTV